MAKDFRVIIAGGRTFNDYNLLESKMDYYLSNKYKQKDNIIIISGAANGADKLGEKYAIDNQLNLDKYPAEWDKYGKSAGYKRNMIMAENADACVVFWDGKSPGSKHMIDICKVKNIPLKVVMYN